MNEDIHKDISHWQGGSSPWHGTEEEITASLGLKRKGLLPTGKPDINVINVWREYLNLAELVENPQDITLEELLVLSGYEPL